MADKVETIRFFLRHQSEYEIKGNRPSYACTTCGKEKDREPGDLETALCPTCGGTMHVHFTKEKNGP